MPATRSPLPEARQPALRTPDGRYLVVRGRLWRTSNPALPEAERQRLTHALMDARRAVKAALKSGDDDALREARRIVHASKVALGERGATWWDDAPDLNRRLVRNTAYAAWHASLEDASLPVEAGVVRLRRFRMDDLARFHAYRSDAEVGRYQGWQPMGEAEASAFVEQMRDEPLFAPGQWCQVAIADAETDELLGDVGIHLAADGRSTEIGFTLARAAQGRGVASAAVRATAAWLLERTSIARVVAVTDARNEPCVRLLERVGFSRVATQPAIFRGEPCVEHTYEFTRRHYDASQEEAS